MTVRDWFVPRFFHLRDKAGQRDLADESVADVEKCAEARDEGSACRRDSQYQGVPYFCRVPSGVGLNAGEDGGQEDSDEREAR